MKNNIDTDDVSKHPVSPEYGPLIARLKIEGGTLRGPDGQADRLFGPVAVRLAERDGLIVRDYTRYFGMGEEIRLTGKGRKMAGLAPIPLLQRILTVFRRPPSV